MDKRERIKNIVLAVVVLAGMCLLPTLTSEAVSLVVLLGAYAITGYGGFNATLEYMVANPAVYGALVYTVMALPVLAWYYVSVTRQRAAGSPSGLVAPPARIGLRAAGVAVLLALGAQGLTSGIMWAFMTFTPWLFEVYTDLVGSSGLTDYSIAWFLGTVVLPPLVEEASFRGLGLGYLRRAGVPFAVANVLQALAFGVFHGNFVQGAYAFALGLLMGYAVKRYGSILAPVVVHAAYNFLGTFVNDMLGALPYIVQDAISLAEFVLLATLLVVLVRSDRRPRPLPADAT